MATHGFYALTFGFTFGVLTRSFTAVPYEWLIAGLVVSFIGALWWARRHSRPALLLSLVLLAGSIGIIRFDATTWDPTPVILDTLTETAILTGAVIREPEVRERTTHVYLRTSTVAERALTATVLLYLDRSTDVTYGDTLTVSGELLRPEPFTTDLGRTFDYPGYLRARDVTHVMYYPEYVREPARGNVLLAALFDFKHAFMRSIESLIPEPQVGLGQGLLLGVKSALGEELEMAFRKTGIIHIVVLSGYNVMLVVVFVMTIFAYVLGLRGRLVFGLMAIAAFALLVGLSATVLRASIMASLILVARSTGRSYAVMRALIFAGLIMLAINPYLLVFDTGFQLSFVATAGLILLAPHLERVVAFVPSTIGIREFLVATLATQLFVMPLLLYQIGEFSVVSVLVNVLVLPMVPVAMLLTFLTGVVGFLSASLALPLAYATHLSLSYIIVVAEWFAGLPFSSYVVPPFPAWFMVLSYAALGYGVWWWHQRSKLPALAMHDRDALAGWTIEEVGAEPKTEPAGELRSPAGPIRLFY